MKNTIPIEPYFFGPPGTATKFEVRVMSGPPDGNNVVFDCHLWTEEEDKELATATVLCTQEQWDAWTDDNDAFFRVLATTAGYAPIAP